MALADLLLLAAFVIFLIAVIVTFVRAKTFDYTDAGLALVVLVMLLGRGAL